MRRKKLLIMVVAGIVCLGLMVTVLPSEKAHAKVIRLKVANFFPPFTFQSKVLEEFCRDLEKRTDGQVRVDYYAGQSLLKAPAMFNGVVSGIADIGYSHVYYTAGRMPVTEAAGLPLGYPSGWCSIQSRSLPI